MSENYGADTTMIYYIGLKGEFKTLNRVPINIVYEASPQLKDHKLPDDGNQMSSHIQ